MEAERAFPAARSPGVGTPPVPAYFAAVNRWLSSALPARVELRRKPQLRPAPTVWHRLEPNRLPDARHRRVPDAARIKNLFTAGLLAGRRRIPHGKDQLVRTGTQVVGEIKRERGGTAGVTADERPVDPKGRFEVDRLPTAPAPVALPRSWARRNRDETKSDRPASRGSPRPRVDSTQKGTRIRSSDLAGRTAFLGASA